MTISVGHKDAKRGIIRDDSYGSKIRTLPDVVIWHNLLLLLFDPNPGWPMTLTSTRGCTNATLIIPLLGVIAIV